MNRVLVIDNYDSFTYNLVQYLGELDAEVTVWRNDRFELAQIESFAPSHIVISPGPCTPAEAGLSIPLVREYAGKYPILGVCLGHQAIGEAFGARVVRAPVLVHGKASPLWHQGQGLLKRLPNPLTAGRYHSLVVVDLPPEFRVDAWATEAGQEVIMAFAHREYPLFGVQFHPESILTESGHQLLANFLAV